MEENQRRRLLWTGVIGSGLVVLCCVTPMLVVLLGLVGLGAITGYLDAVLLPALALFLGLALYAGTRRQQDTGGACCTSHESESRKP